MQTSVSEKGMQNLYIGRIKGVDSEIVTGEEQDEYWKKT